MWHSPADGRRFHLVDESADVQRHVEPPGPQILHAIRECPDARQNEPVLNYSAVTSLQPDDGHWKLTTNLLFEVQRGGQWAKQLSSMY